MDIRFGFLTEPVHIGWSAGQIAPSPDHQSIVDAMSGHDRVYDGWCYPPLAPVPRVSNESAQPPGMPLSFTVPATHVLRLESEHASRPFAEFVIALLGMLKGQRLIPEGWQHFYKAPLGRKLNDFYADNREITRALNTATEFWSRVRDADIRQLVFGGIHWHLFAQLYEHDFERFNAQYTVLDTCYKIAIQTRGDYGRNRKKANHRHADRASSLCQELCVPEPDWAVPRKESSGGLCDLSQRRNALVHEALYGGYPIGFAHPQTHQSMELELTCLVARLLLRLLGIENEYTRSRCNTRQTHGFAFEAYKG